MLRQEMLLEGVLALSQGEHPRVIAERLNGMLSQSADSNLKPAPTSGMRQLPVRPRNRAKSHATSSIRSH